MPLQIIRQDITKIHCDAIVNSTNRHMVGLSGVDLAIHRAAGPLLEEECKNIMPLQLGTAVATKGYNLESKYIIHTSGPIWRGGYYGEKTLLKCCYIESLNLAKKLNCESIAFPLISSGNYGYPKDQVLSYAVEIISDFLLDNEMQVYLCVYDKTSYEFSKELYKDIKSYIDTTDVEDNYGRYDFKKYNNACCNYYQIDFSRDKKDENEIRHNKTEILSNQIQDVQEKDLSKYLDKLDKSYMETLFYHIDKKGMTDVECYKKANVDRKTFSKLKNNPNQKPKKQTAVALGMALELNLTEMQHLLKTVGLTLSESQKFDMIIRYFIEHHNYNVFEINEALFEFDQVLLGSN